MIDRDGNYAIFRYSSGTSTTLASGSSGSINTGTANNRIKVERSGSSIKAYANGQLLASIWDGTYTGTRRVGLIVSSYDQPNVDARFDNFTVYPATCGGANVTALGEATGKAEAMVASYDLRRAPTVPGSGVRLYNAPAD